MADNVSITPGAGETIATDDIGGVQYQRVKQVWGADGVANDVTTGNPLPVGVQGTVPVSGPLTDTQLRATAVPVSGPLTDTQLRATAVPVSGPLTDTQLRATAVPVSAASLPLPSGAATETTLAALNAKIPPAGQTTMAASQPVTIASNQTAVPTTGNVLSLTGQATQTAVVNNILEAAAGSAGTDVTNFRSASVQVVSTGTGGTFIFEQSNDNTNWQAIPVFNAQLGSGAFSNTAITATASQIIYTFPIVARFVRLRIATTITGGSIQAFSRFSADPWTSILSTVANNVSISGYPTAAASADALANPTVTQVGAAGLLFNGTTWDRARNNLNVTVEASSAKTATGNGATQTNFNASGVFVWINVTVVTGTTPTLTVRLQWSPDGGTTWVDLDTTNAQTASITATGAAVLRIYPGIATTANASLNAPLPRTWRLAWTIGGTTPSFTFTAQASYVN